MKNLIIMMLFIVVNATANIIYQPDNLNFERGRPGYVPDSWIFPAKLETAGYSANIDDKTVYEGRYSVALINPNYNADTASVGESQNMSTLYQSVDAYPFRNKMINFSAWVRTQHEEFDAKGELWIVVRDEKKNIVLSVYGENDLIRDSIWHKKELTAIIPKDADELRFGFLLEGKSSLWIDAVSLNIIDPEGSIDLPPATLSEKVLPNLLSFAKLYGYLYHFYPSNTFRSVDQERLLLYSVSNILTDNFDFAKDMKSLLKEIAPQANILAKNEQLNYSYKTPTAIQDKIAYVSEIAGGPVLKNSPAFYSMLRNIYSTTRSREGSVFQNVDMIKNDNKRIVVSAMIKVDGLSPGSNAQIWCKTDIVNSDKYTFATSSENPALDNEWKNYSVEMIMPENVYNLRLALVFLGEGKAYFDDVKIQMFDGNKMEKEFIVPNGDFEKAGAGQTLNSWQIEPAVINAGYSAGRDQMNKYRGAFSLRISSDINTMIKFPELGKLARFSINDKHDIVFPYVLPQNQEISNVDLSEKLSLNGKPHGYNPKITDRTTRLASVIQLWNIIKHFSMNDLNNDVLDNLLVSSLKSASIANSLNDFNDILNNMMMVMQDPRATTWNQFYESKYGLPIVFHNFDDDIIVTSVIDQSLAINPGEIIKGIDGVNIEDVIENYSSKHYSVNPDYNILRALANIRSGEKNSECVLTISDKSGQVRDIRVKRNELLSNIYEPRPEPIVELDTAIYYVDMTQMSDKTFKNISDQIGQVKAFVFDLRGFIIMSEHMLSLFSDKDIQGVRWEIPIYTKPEKKLISKKVFAGGIKGRSKYPDTKLIFLIDESTIGYSEAVAQIIKDEKIGILLGAPTAGLIGEAYTTRLIGGTSISLTGMKAYDSNNGLINGKSIQPDVLLHRNHNKFLNYTELLLEKALELLNN